MYRISDIKYLFKDKFGIEFSIDQLRKLEKARIIFTTRNLENNYRQLSEEQFKKSVRNLILYYFNTPIEDILKDNPDIIQDRIKKIKKALKLLA